MIFLPLKKYLILHLNNENLCTRSTDGFVRHLKSVNSAQHEFYENLLYYTYFDFQIWMRLRSEKDLQNIVRFHEDTYFVIWPRSWTCCDVELCTIIIVKSHLRSYQIVNKMAGAGGMILLQSNESRGMLDVITFNGL